MTNVMHKIHQESLHDARSTKYKIFNIWVSVHHKSILYKETTRCDFGSLVY